MGVEVEDHGRGSSYSGEESQVSGGSQTVSCVPVVQSVVPRKYYSIEFLKLCDSVVAKNIFLSVVSKLFEYFGINSRKYLAGLENISPIFSC